LCTYKIYVKTYTNRETAAIIDTAVVFRFRSMEIEWIFL